MRGTIYLGEHRLSIAAALAALLCGACGDDAADGEDLARLCTAECEWRARCGSGNPDCVPHCQGEGALFIGNYREDVINKTAECYMTRSCGGGGDACFASVLLGIPDWMASPPYRQCTSTRERCKAEGKPTFSDDHCASVLLLTDEARQRMAACYERPCEEMNACIKAIVG